MVGGTKNTTLMTVPLSNGVKVTTIPDLWGRNVGGLIEVKNVEALSNSNQLRAQIREALKTRQPLNLVLSPRTRTVSQKLVDDIKKQAARFMSTTPQPMI
ncbi:MAG: putative toxin [Rhizobium oryzihabitans]